MGPAPMRALLFWSGLYLACVATALAVTPGLPEALGFALPPLLATGLAAWMVRRQAPAMRLAVVVGAAAILMFGGLTGAMSRGQGLDQTATDRAATSLG
jgi:hypothetical protein